MKYFLCAFLLFTAACGGVIDGEVIDDDAVEMTTSELDAVQTSQYHDPLCLPSHKLELLPAKDEIARFSVELYCERMYFSDIY